MFLNVKLFSVIIFSFSTLLFSQNDWNPKKTANKGGRYSDTTVTIRINKSLPKMFIRYRAYFEPNVSYSDFGTTYFRVEIKKTSKGKPVQVIESESEAYYGPIDYDYGYKDSGFEGMLVDINFDGFKDLRFKTSTGANAYTVNQFYEYYLYNPKTKLFRYYEGLSDITNPTPYPDEKRVYSYHRMAFSGTDGVIEIYKWVHKSLKIQESIAYEVFDKNSDCSYWKDKKCKYNRWRSYYKENQLVKSDSIVIDVKDIPRRHLLYW